MKAAISVAVATIFVLSVVNAATADQGKTRSVIAAELEEYRYNEPRKIGVMAGARHFCSIEIKQFLHAYSTRIGFTMQRPDMLWDRMIDQAKSTVAKLRTEGDGCPDETKAYVERLAY